MTQFGGARSRRRDRFNIHCEVMQKMSGPLAVCEVKRRKRRAPLPGVHRAFKHSTVTERGAKL